MEQVHGVCVHTKAEEKEVKPQPTYEQLLAEKDLGVSSYFVHVVRCVWCVCVCV